MVEAMERESTESAGNIATAPLISRAIVRAMTGVSQATLDRWARQGHMPRPILLSPGAKSLAYDRAEINSWVESRRQVRACP